LELLGRAPAAAAAPIVKPSTWATQPTSTNEPRPSQPAARVEDTRERTVQAVQARVVDTSGVETTFVDISTPEIILWTDGLQLFVVPVAIAKIVRVPPEKELRLHSDSIASGINGPTVRVTTTGGLELVGKCQDSFKGTTDLGSFEISFRDLQAAYFSPTNVNVSTERDRSGKGYSSTVTDRAGNSVLCHDFGFDFTYVYGKGYPDPNLYASDPFRRYFLPVKHKGLLIPIPFTEIAVATFSGATPSGDRFGVNWEAPVSVLLHDGRTLAGRMTNYINEGFATNPSHFTARTDFGRLSLLFKDGKEIRFHREKSAPAQPDLGTQDIETSCATGYTLTYRTWRDEGETVLLDVGQLELNRGYRWLAVTPALDVRVGSGESRVSFDNIRSLRFFKEGEPGAELVSSSSKSVTVSVQPSLWLAGRHALFGPGRVQIADIAALKISHS
jgi:hypothetical protein